MRRNRSADVPTLKQSLAIGAGGAAITAAILFLSTDVHAQEPPAEGGDWNVVLGAGTIYAPDYEGSKDYEVLPFPFVSVGYKDIAYLRGPEVGVNIIRIKPAENMKIRFGPVARYRRDRPEKRNAALIGLGKVDMAIEVGGSARLEAGPAWIEVSMTKDVADGHDGLVATATGGVDFDLTDKLSLSLSGTTSWVDDKYMRTYFGVTPIQAARSRLPVFAAGKGMKDAGTNASVQYRLTDHWIITATGGYTRLLGDAKDAPLVRLRGSPNQWQAGFFVAYRF